MISQRERIERRVQKRINRIKQDIRERQTELHFHLEILKELNSEEEEDSLSEIEIELENNNFETVSAQEVNVKKETKRKPDKREDQKLTKKELREIEREKARTWA
jgi:hypothetical protein